MKTNFLYAVAVLALVSCKKELEPQESSGKVDSTAVAGTTPATQSVQMTPQAAPQQPQQQVAQTAPGMNPPHGQPGHRCDIAVGAPLSSAPKAATPGNITVNPPKQGTATIVPPPQGTTTPVKTAPGMNPPHGQPGHRCDIAVGQPLPKDGDAKAAPTDVPAILAPPVENAPKQ